MAPLLTQPAALIWLTLARVFSHKVSSEGSAAVP
jgi:hypothetical protein